MQLAPCPSCARHVRASETACPFCASAITVVAVPRPRPKTRLSRAATYALGAAALAGVAAVAPGCSTSRTEDAGVDGGIGPVYGAPADLGTDSGRDAGIDSGFAPPYGIPPGDSGPPADGGGAPIYGAAPPR